MQVHVLVEDLTTPALNSFLERTSSTQVSAILGNAARTMIRDHLQAKGQTPNKHGWPKTGWYTRARDSVTMTYSADGAVVTIALEGFASRYYGQPDRITPKNRRYLTIPMASAAYGRSAREFTDLHAEMFRTPRGRTAGFLVRQIGPVKVRMYRLVLWTEPKADPSMLPTPDEIRTRCTEALQVAVEVAATRT